MKNYPISQNRALLEQLRESKSLSGLNITPGYLLDYKQISNSEYSYDMNFSSSNPLQERPRVLLSPKDVFVVTHLRVELFRAATAKPGAFIPQTYPNAVEFGANAAADLAAFYNADLIVRIGDNVIFDPIPTRQFLHVPELVELPVETGGQPAIPVTAYQDSFGLALMEPGLVLNGLRENAFTVKIRPFATGTTPAWAGPGSGTEHYVAIYAKGFKVSDAARSHYELVVEALRGR